MATVPPLALPAVADVPPPPTMPPAPAELLLLVPALGSPFVPATLPLLLPLMLPVGLLPAPPGVGLGLGSLVLLHAPARDTQPLKRRSVASDFVMTRGAWHEIVKTVPHMRRSGEFPRSSLKIFHGSVDESAV